jgi:hypothetical protein
VPDDEDGLTAPPQSREDGYHDPEAPDAE